MKAQLLKIDATETRLTWYCPGCKSDHGVPIPPSPRAWQWNGSLNTPTLSPSVLLTSGHHVSGHTGDCWCSVAKRRGQPPVFDYVRCHSFIREGRIEFLGDCSHELAGQTVEMREET